MNSSDFDPRAETARFLGLPIEEIDYLDDLPQGIGLTPQGELPPSDEEVSDIEVAAAESRGLVVPNRISYGIFLNHELVPMPSISFNRVVGGPGRNCRQTGNRIWLSIEVISRYMQEGWCFVGDRPTRRYKIWWREY